MPGYLPNEFCKPGNFDVWLSRPAETGRDAYFNSALSTVKAGANGNATLTIYLRVLLQKKGKESPAPVDGNQKKFPHRNWNEAEFANYQREVKRLADDYWGGLPSSPPKFCIVPSPEYHGLDWPVADPKLKLNVDCRFEMVFANGLSDAHAVVECYRLDTDKDPGFRSSWLRWTNFDIVAGNSCAKIGCTEDVFKGFDKDGIIPMWNTVQAQPQITVLHEVGHQLGLPHVGEFVKNKQCLDAIAIDPSDGQNDSSCYRGNSIYDKLNIMGIGMNLAKWNAMPWWRRLAEHTGTTLEGWNISMSRVPAARLTAKSAAAGVP